MSNQQKPVGSTEAPVEFRTRQADDHKGTFGRVLLVGGSRGMSGSIAMSTIAAMRTGSGLVSAAVPDRCLETVAGFHPAAMTIPLADDHAGRFSPIAVVELCPHLHKMDALGIGPGMTTEAGSLRIVERLLSTPRLPRVFDADAINLLPEIGWQDYFSQPLGSLVLTPHPGELKRLVGVSTKDRPGQIQAAQQLSQRSGATIVVKGGPTVVVSGNQRYVNSTGNPGMASGGSGDVLTGIITSLLGQGLPPWDAARLGVWVHGHAGDLAAQKYGPAGMTAVEILDCLPLAMQSVAENPADGPIGVDEA